MKTSPPIAAAAPAGIHRIGHALRTALERWFYFGIAWLVLEVGA